MLALIRHPAVALPSGRCYGRLDVELADAAAIPPIVERLADMPAFLLWSSPALRCVAVASAIASAFGARCRRDPRLLELDFGVWEGMAWADVPRGDLDRWAACPVGFAPPGGESGASLIARVAAFHADLGQLAGSHVVVAHGGPLRLLAALAHGRPPDLLAPSPALGSVSIIQSPGIRTDTSRREPGDDAKHGAFGDDLGRAEDVARGAADLPSGEGGHGQRRARRGDDAGQRHRHRQ